MQNKALATTSVRLGALQRQRTVSLAGRSRYSKKIFRRNKFFKSNILTSRVPVREYRNLPRAQSATEETVAPVTTMDQSKDALKRQHYIGKKAMVVGSGPAGSVAAAFLAKQGFDVEVYEKRNDPTQAMAKAERPVPLSLTRASVNVVEAIDIELPSTGDEYKNGLRRHIGMSILSKDGPLVSIPLDRQERFVATRSDFAKTIIANVRDKNPEKITFHFEHPCIGIDLTKQQVQFRDQDNSIVKREYDLLVAADGANSQIRNAMEKEMEDFKVSTTTNLGFYKVFAGLPAAEDAVPEKYKMLLQPSHINVYRLAPELKRGGGLQTILFCRVAGGDLTGYISGSASGFESVKGKEKEYLIEVTPEWFPQDWIDRLAVQLKDNPVSRCSAVIEVSSLVGPGVVLIGDAGHSVTNSIGQGASMAVQDGQFLNDALESAKGDISLALKEFNQSRFEAVRQTQALDLVAGAPFLEHKGIRQLLPALVKMHTVLHIIGSIYLPWLVPKPVITRFQLEEVSVEEAIQILKAELVTLSVIAAAMSYVSTKAIMSLF